MDDGGWFDGAQWSRLDRRGDREGARDLLSAALDRGGAAAMAEIAAYYLTLGADRGWTLLHDLSATPDHVDTVVPFYEAVRADASRPSEHRETAVHLLAGLRAPGFEALLIEELTARSEGRRIAALDGLARRGTETCVEPVMERVKVVLRRPAFDVHDNRYRGELLPAFVAVLRCAERQQLVPFAQLLRLRQAHLSGVEFSWLRDLWPGPSTSRSTRRCPSRTWRVCWPGPAVRWRSTCAGGCIRRRNSVCGPPGTSTRRRSSADRASGATRLRARARPPRRDVTRT